MSGYQETLTDPSYHRQVVVATAPHIGNTGWNDEDDESSRIWVAGYVIRDPARVPSNWRSRRTLADELAAQGIVVGMSDVDTRALTRHLRERGAMRVGVSSVETDPDALLARVLEQPSMLGAHLADEVSTGEAYVIEAARREAADRGGGRPRHQVDDPVPDGRAGDRDPRSAGHRDLRRYRRPEPDGVFFSNGPGDPEAAEGPIEVLREVLAAGIPYFGICFGNQLFGRALGFGTYKLTYGHRGINQPVMDLTTRRVEITAHNHGFAVDAPLGGPTQTPYGHRHGQPRRPQRRRRRGPGAARRRRPDPRFSVQYHPEAAAGPHDASYLFDRFVDLMDACRQAQRRRSSPSPPIRGPEADEGIADAEAHRHRLDPGDRLRPDRDRPGLRVRLLRHPGLPGAARPRGSGSSWSTPTRPRS